MKKLYTGGKEVEEAFPPGYWVPTAVTWVPSMFFQALLRLGVPSCAVELSKEDFSFLLTLRAKLLRSGSLRWTFCGAAIRPGFCWRIPHSFPGAWQECWPQGARPCLYRAASGSEKEGNCCPQTSERGSLGDLDPEGGRVFLAVPLCTQPAAVLAARG